MNVGDFLEVTVSWDLPTASEPVLNTWDFEVTAVELPIGLLLAGDYIAAAFVAKYVTPILPVVSNQMGCVKISIRDYSDETEGYDKSDLFGIGAAGTAMLPPFVTLSILAQRRNYALRNGRKAIPGACSGSLAMDGKIAQGTLDVVDAAIEDWHETLFVEAGENTISMAPRIIRKPLTPNTNPTLFSTISAYSLNRRFGSQNSRK